MTRDRQVIALPARDLTPAEVYRLVDAALTAEAARHVDEPEDDDVQQCICLLFLASVAGGTDDDFTGATLASSPGLLTVNL